MINLNYDNTGKKTQTVRTYRIRPTSVAALEDVDQITDWIPCPVREDATEWPTAKRIQVLAGTVDNERITAPVVAERVDWHENAFSAQECFPKYQIVQGTAPEGATDVFYKSYDSDRITRYAVLEEDSDD